LIVSEITNNQRAIINFYDYKYINIIGHFREKAKNITKSYDSYKNKYYEKS